MKILKQLFHNNKYWPIVALVTIIGLLLFNRVQKVNEPLHHDMCVYAYVGHQMLEGEVLYSDLIDNKPPGIYFLYMFAEMIGGYNQHTYYWLGSIFSLLSLIFLFLLLKKSAGNSIALIGALIWAMISMSYSVGAHQPNTEIFLNTLLLFAIWAFCEYIVSNKNYLWLSGIGFGLASVFKINVFFVFLALSLFFIIRIVRKKEKYDLKSTALDMLRLIVPGILIWGLIFVFFLIAGNFNDFYDVVFKASKNYAGNIFLNEFRFIASLPKLIFLPIVKEIAIVIVLSLAWLFWRGKSDKGIKKVVALYFIGTLLMIGALSVQARHYYQVLLPPLTLMAALYFKRLSVFLEEKKIKKRLVFTLVLIITFGYLGYFQWKSLKISPLEFALKTESLKIIKEQALGKIISKITSPEEKIYQWGLAPTIYFYSKRNAASGIVIHHIMFFGEKNITLKYMNKTINDLISNKPAFFIFTSWLGQLRQHKIFETVMKEYRFFGTFGKNIIFERKGRKERFESVLEDYAKNPEEYGYYTPKDKLRLAGDYSLKRYNPAERKPRGFIRVSGTGKYAGHINEGVKYVLNKEVDKAILEWSKAGSVRPGRYEAEANIAIAQEMRGHLSKAINGYERLAASNGSPWDEYYKETVLRIEHEARQILTEPIKKNIKMTQRILLNAKGSDEYANLVNLGIKAVQDKKIYDAEKYWVKAKRLQPDRPEARANLAVLLERSRKFDQALKEYKYAAEKLGAPWNKYYEELKGFMDKR